MIITRQMLRDWGACYDDDKVARYVPETGLTPLQVLDLDIPHADRRWVVMREAIIPTRQRIELVCLWAERALSRVATPDPRSVAAIEATRRYARGEATIEELRSARSAAYAAAAAAAAYAAYAAAYAADADYAAYAAYAAADAAAYAAADAAAYARRQELGQQIEDIRVVLLELDERAEGVVK